MGDPRSGHGTNVELPMPMPPARSLTIVWFMTLAACGTLDAQGPPLAPPPTIAYVQNINIAYTANVAPTQPIVEIPSGGSASSTLSVAIPPALPAAMVVVPERPSDVAGVAVCETYIDRIEDCSRRMLPDTPEGHAVLAHDVETLDLARREWRWAAQTPGRREIEVDSCERALRTYNDTFGARCR